MSSLIRAMAEVFIFLMQLVVDLLCVVLLLVSLAGFWRWPFLCDLHSNESARNKLRGLAVLNFGTVMLDIVVAPFLCITLCSWRSFRMCGRIADCKSEDFYNVNRRGAVMLEFVLFIFDIPFVLMLALAHATFWRIPFLWKDLANEFGAHGFPIFNCSEFNQTSKFRLVIGLNALNGVVDLFLAPFALIVLVTWYRVPIVRGEWQKLGTGDRNALLHQKLAVVTQCLNVLVDAPCALVGLLTVLLGFRARALVEDLLEATSAGDRRGLCFYHFALSVRDWLCVPLCVPLLASIYRGYFCYKGIRDAITSWDQSEPMLHVRSVTLELPVDRGTGVKVHVRATRRDATFKLDASSSVKLYVRNGSIWKGIGRAMGATAGALGPTMVPLSLAPKYMDVQQIERLPVGPAESEVNTAEPLMRDASDTPPVPSADPTNERTPTPTPADGGTLLLDFAVGTCRCIRRNANRLSSEHCDIQVQYEGAVRPPDAPPTYRRCGTLFGVTVNFADFDKYVDSGVELPLLDVRQGYASELMQGKRFCDVFWKHVLVEFAYLLFDVVVLLFLLLLHLFPHRVYRVYSTGCEGSARKRARRELEAAAALREYLLAHRFDFFGYMDKFDTFVRKRLNRLEHPSPDDPESARRQRKMAAAAATPSLFPMETEYRYWRRVKRDESAPAPFAPEVLASLTERAAKARTAGSEALAVALEAYTEQLSRHAVLVKNLYLQHFNNEQPFCKPFDALGGAETEELVVDDAVGAPLRQYRSSPSADRSDDAAVVQVSSTRQRIQAKGEMRRESRGNAESDELLAMLMFSEPDPYPLRSQSRTKQSRRGDDANSEESLSMLSANIPTPTVPPPDDIARFRTVVAPTDEEEADSDMQRVIAESLAPNNRQQEPEAQSGQDDVAAGEGALTLPAYSEPSPAGSGEGSPAAGVAGPTAADAAALGSPDDAVQVAMAGLEALIAQTEAAIPQLTAAVDETPWFGGREGWVGVRPVVVREVKLLMYDFVTLVSLVVVACTLYRVVPFARSLPQVNNVRRAAIGQLKEMCLDGVYVGKAVLVLLFVRGIVSLPADLCFYLLQKPSFNVARQVVDHHLRLVMEDLWYVLSLVFAWDTLRFVLATAVFGVFSPCVILEGAFTPSSRSGAHRIEWGLCVAGCFLVMASAWVVGVPVFVGYYVAGENVTHSPAAVFFGIMGGILLLGLVVNLLYRDPEVVSIQRNAIKTLGSFEYVGLAGAMLLDLAQLLALVFGTARADLYGATIGSGLEQASHYVYGTFGASWTRLGVPFGVYLAIVLALLYFVVSGAPVVCGDMLHWRKGARIIESPVWVGGMELLGQTCMLTVVRNVATLFVCEEGSQTLSFSTPDTSYHCWRGPVRSLTVFAAILLTYYVPTALMKNQKFNVALMKSVDVVFPQMYLCLTRLPVAACCVLCTLMHQHRIVVLSLVLGTMAWCVGVSLLYRRAFDSPFCSVQSVGAYRATVYAAVGLCAAVVLAQLCSLDDAAVQASAPTLSYWSLYAAIGILAAALGVCVACCLLFARPTTAEEDTIDDVKEKMFALREHLAAVRALRRSGLDDVEDRVWAKRMHTATRCSQLAMLVLALEQRCYTVHVSPLFLSTRKAWEAKAMSIVHPYDRNRTIDIDWHDYGRWYYGFCCGCCDDVWSHGRRSQDRDVDDKGAWLPEAERLVLLQEVAMALYNAAMRR